MDSDHAMIRRALEKFGDVTDNITEDKFVIFGIEPAKISDASEKCYQPLNYELSQLWLVV